MEDALSGWYGLLMIIIVLSVLGLIVSVLGAAILRLMLRDDVYYPEEQ